MTIAPPKALAELQRWPHWVIWREEERDGKPTKVPYQARYPERRASSTDPATWATHMAAKSALAQGKGDGLGYVFAEDDEYAGIDLDHCVIDGKVAFGARAIVDRLNSYTELSPSGTGLHVIVRAGLNGGRNRTKTTSWGGDFEAYDRGRFFTITGEHLPGTPTTIESRQEELDAIRAELFPAPPTANVALTNGKPPAPVAMDDHALLEKIRASKQGPKFAELYDRGAPEGQESEADLGLCNILAFWCGPDDARIDSLFRSSALMRDKWDSPRGETTYGGYTINRALEGRTEFYRPPAPRRKPPKYEGRQEAEAGARAEVERLLGLEGDDRRVLGGRAWGRDLSAAVEVDISDGSMLRFDSLSAFTSPAKMNAAIAFQIGSQAKLTQAGISELFGNLRIICEAREALTLDRRAMDVGITFMQEIGVYPADVPTSQGERWQGFLQLAGMDPIKESKESGESIAAKALALVDSHGTRYVRVSWFTAYCKAVTLPGSADDIVRRMLSLGWGQQGTEGRIKATEPGGTRTLQWAFFTVPEGWEKQ